MDHDLHTYDGLKSEDFALGSTEVDDGSEKQQAPQPSNMFV
jgi:hypothetical protein